jgi:hypothetical protein
MKTRERWEKLGKSLQENPIKLFEEESWSIGLQFFWRILILACPAWALVAAFEFEWMDPNTPLSALLSIVAIVYFVYVLGVSEYWRSKGNFSLTGNSPKETMKQGLSLWWRILVRWVAFVIPLVILFAISYAVLDENGTLVVAIIAWFVLSPPIMGYAVRHLERTKQVEAAAGAPATPQAQPGA